MRIGGLGDFQKGLLLWWVGVILKFQSEEIRNFETIFLFWIYRESIQIGSDDEAYRTILAEKFSAKRMSCIFVGEEFKEFIDANGMK